MVTSRSLANSTSFRALTALWASSQGITSRQFDVVITDAKETGFAAAVAACRLGLKVALISSTDRIGGMTGGGICRTDVNSKKSVALVQGFAAEFYRRYANADTTPFTLQQFIRSEGPTRPSRIQRNIDKFIGELQSLSIILNMTPVSVVKGADLNVTSATFEDDAGQKLTLSARVFIDGSYTGDLARFAGLTTVAGRSETNASESLAGFKAPGGWNSPNPIDPYVTPGQPASGLIVPFRVPSTTTVGAADGLPLANGYRVFITSVAADKMAWPAPSNYDPTRYEWLRRDMIANPTYYGEATLGLTRLFQFYDLGTNGGTPMGPTYLTHVDINSLGAGTVNFPFPDLNLEYLTANRARRKVIEEMAWQWILGIAYFLNNDSSVPAALKTAWQAYGLSNKEYARTGGRPYDFYVRGSTRLGAGTGAIMRQAHILSFSNGLTSSTIPLIDRAHYYADCPVYQSIVVGGVAKQEGAVLSDPGEEAGAPIPWTAILPSIAESKNTLHPGGGYWTAVVETSIRMAINQLRRGYAAGVIAYLAIQGNCPVQNIDVVALARLLDLDEAWKGLTASADGSAFQMATRVESSGTGTWAVQSTRPPYFGMNVGGSARIIPSGSTKTVRYFPSLYSDTPCRVRLMFPAGNTQAGAAAASNVTIRIVTADGTFTRTIDMRLQDGSGGGGAGGYLVDLGTFFFRKGPTTANPTSPDYVEIDPTGADGVVADGGIQFIPVRG